MVEQTDTESWTAGLQEIARRHPEIAMIVSPPRCSSTTMARIFWEHPSFRYYCHEPFELPYYEDVPLTTVTESLGKAIDLTSLKKDTKDIQEGLVIKMMSFQVGEHFPEILRLATRPVIFLLRDPLRSVYSRYLKKQQAGQSGIFATNEMGFEPLEQQVETCRTEGIEYVIVDSSDYRKTPAPITQQLFSALGLPFSADLLQWRSMPDFQLDNLDGRQAHFYKRVLSSTGIEPDDAPRPRLEDFPEDDSFRERVAAQTQIYERLLKDPRCLR